MKSLLDFFNKNIFNTPINSLIEIPCRIINKLIHTLQIPPNGFGRYHANNFISSCAKKYDLKNKKLLDVGAGHQPYKAYFKNCIYESCDNEEVISDIKYDIANAKHTFNADINKNIPREDEYYDLVLCSEVLEHVYNPLNVISEISRILKKDGILILTVPQSSGEHMLPHNYFNYLKNGVKYLLEKNNFKIESIEASCGIFHVMGNVLNKMINFIFGNLNIFFRTILFPLELVLRIIVSLINILLFILDRFDKEKKWTLTYLCIAKKIS
tara:strand:- start:332 stop:1138 length:807 start_codon:yes stop_codon:yes gene_type:complete